MLQELVVDPDGAEFQIDFDKLDEDPNEQAKLNYLLEAERYRRNTMLLDTFERKYAVLFRKEAVSMDPAMLQEISKEYLGNIDPYYPVYVVKSLNFVKVSDLIKPSNVVYKLPPLYNRVGVVNDLGRDGINIMQAFNNIVANGIDDRFDHKKKQYAKYLGTVFEAMTDNDALARNQEAAKEMSDQALKRSLEYKNKTASVTSDDPVLEVQDIPEDMIEDISQASDNTVFKSVPQEEYL